MSKSTKSKNRLLAQLPDQELAELLPHLEPIELPLGFLIVAAGQKIDYVYFLESGLGSAVAVSPEGAKAEAGMFGSEGFAPTPAAIGFALSHFEFVIQSPGSAHRVGAVALFELLKTCPVLDSFLRRSSHNLATQVAYTALSNAVHQVDERLARWLLMCNDRIAGDEIPITHDYISLMLAVRRPSVTTALHVLEGNGFIKSTRGLIAVRNREALEEFAHDAYGKPEEEYEQLFGPDSTLMYSA
jgi:CRP-like cAMP-binding protein